MRWNKAVAAVMAALALVAGACRDGGEGPAAPTGTVRTDVPTTTTTTDPYAVPAVIDVAYVNRVLAGLDALTGEAFRLYMRERKITPEISERLKAAYGTGEIYDLKVRAFELDKDSPVSSEPGDAKSTITRLITATPACIYAKVSRDFRPAGGTVIDLWVGLRHPAVPQDYARYNPTPWIYVVDGFRPDRSEPANPCASS